MELKINKTPMTFAEREAIFAKEIITVLEFSRLLNCAYPTASAKMLDIKRYLKRNGKLRLDIDGKIHVQDYLDYFKLDGNSKRYMRRLDEQDF